MEAWLRTISLGDDSVLQDLVRSIEGWYLGAAFQPAYWEQNLSLAGLIVNEETHRALFEMKGNDASRLWFCS